MVDQQNTTDNHDWNYPAPGYNADSPTWGELLNTIIEDDLDREVIVKGAYADRPAAGQADRWYLATDRRIIFRDTGDSWEPVAGVGTESNPVPEQYVESLNADHTDTDTLDATEPGGAVFPTGLSSFQSEFIDEPFESDTLDPEIIHRRHYDDGLYRVVIGQKSTDETHLYTTSDFKTFTLVSSDILPTVTGTGQCAGIEVLNDGTRVFMESTDSGTNLWTGPDLQNLSNQGEVVPEPDGGTFYEVEAGTLHYYPEDADTASGVSSEKLSHWTIPDDNLTNATQQSDAIDVSGQAWVTGDPHIIEMGDIYYMFFDRTESHPDYRIALATSEDLYDWQIWTDNINPASKVGEKAGGDLTITKRNGWFEGFVEYSQYDAGSDSHNGIGHWRLYPRSVPPWVQFRGQKADIAHTLAVRNTPGGPSNNSSGFAVVDENGDVVGRFTAFNNSPSFDALPGSDLRFGIAGTGSAELEIFETGKTKVDRQGSNVWNFHDDQGVDQAAQDLSALSLTSAENGRIYRHDGSSSISADGGTTSSPGYYVWDNSASEFKSVVQF